MPGVNITGLKFDQESRKALYDIRRRKSLFKGLKAAIGGGTIINIFLGNKSYEVVVNIYFTDFKTMGQAIRGVNNIEAKVIAQVAFTQALRHSGKEHLFWEGIYNELVR